MASTILAPSSSRCDLVRSTCISCHPMYRFLASASPYNSSVIIWDRVLGVGTPLARWGGPGIHLVKWSPNGHYLFAATTYAPTLLHASRL
jgi:hypothetical protein